MAGSFIIGIDFGTTYSGVAWCWSQQPDNIDLVTRWKANRYMAQDNAKTLSQLYYEPETRKMHWGYSIPPDAQAFSWFKLLLVDPSLLPREFRDSTQISTARRMINETFDDETTGVITVTADYLRLLWKHTIDAMERDRGREALSVCPFKVWVTVPAIWDERARRKMRQAIQQAGILDVRSGGLRTELELVAEPEAAAFAVLNDYKGRPDVKKGEVFTVCDAGGGTVDIISYEVLNVDPLTFEECVEGRGKLCGAIFVDEAFEATLKARLGTKWERMNTASQKHLINNEWEHGIKRNFDDTDENQDWTVTVSPQAFDTRRPTLNRFGDRNKDMPLEHGQLKFKRGHIRAWFGKVIPQIRGLIREQIAAVQQKKGYGPKAIMLVGGLGACNYLFKELRTEFQQGKGITVLQPNGARPWTAICRGAVIRGVNDANIKSSRQTKIVSRVSRVSYGLDFQTKYHAGRHLSIDKYWCPQHYEYRAKNQMEWYLERGQKLYHKEPIQFSYYLLCRKAIPQVELIIYRSTEEEPPDRVNTGVVPYFTITADVTTPFESLPKWVNPNKETFRKLSYKVEMVTTGTSMEWTIYVNGVVQGKQTVTIEEADDYDF